MVKNHSRKTKKKGGRKYHIGGEYYDDRQKIPTGIVNNSLPIFGEDVKPSITVEPNPNKLKDHIPESTNVESSTKPSERQFQFTRHVLSCNNLKEGKYYTAGKDFEPGATVYGIFETIKYAQEPEQIDNFNFDHVYVSNLYRTWITAVLLYGTNLSTDRLNLYISPFLKEYHGLFKRGNFPKEIKHMANKFLKFLTELHSYCIDSEGDVDELYSQRDRTNWYDNLPKEIVLHLPPGQNNKSNQIKYEKLESEPYKLTSFCNIEDTAGPNSGAGFTQTGDLQKFMEWYSNESSNYFGSHDENNKVHIVTHSHIMRDYLSKFKVTISEEGKAPQAPINFDIDAIDNPSLKEIRKSNSWHFITTQNKLSKQGTYANIDSAKTDLKLVKGVPIKKEEAKNLEDKNKDQSLCGTEGSVNPVAEICATRGGRKLRKRNIRRTKKHSKRRNNKSRKHHK